MNEKIFKDLIKTRKALKQKYKTLKTGEIARETELETTFNPIVKPLKELINVTQLNQISNKIIKQPKHNDLKPQKLKFESYTTSSPKSNIEKNYKTPQWNNITWSPTPIKTSDLDVVYGPYFDNNSNIRRMGKSVFTIDEKTGNILVDNISFKSSPGLQELIFHKKPENYTENDLTNFYKILDITNAHLKDTYDTNSEINGTRAQKYIKIIKKHRTHPYNTRNAKIGSTYLSKIKTLPSKMEFSSKPIEYVHWDDPNELVNRLRLLIASQEAGNNIHNNEIISIIEELKEANLIE